MGQLSGVVPCKMYRRVVLMDLLLILNPVAGKRELRKTEKEIRAIFREAGYNVSVLYTKEGVPLSRQLRRIGRKPDLIVCAGGDGTLNQTVSGILELGLETPVGYLPAGSTNDFAQSLQLPKKLTEAAARILQSSARSLDIGFMQPGQYFIYVAAFGAFSSTSYTATQNMKNRFGHFAYVLEAIKELPKIRSHHVKITTENEVFEDDYIFGAVCNTRSIGGVIKLSPSEAQLDDGRFELFLVKSPKNLREFWRILYAVVSHKRELDVITFRHVKSVSFESREEICWSLDGERGHEKTKTNIETLPRTLSFLY